MVPTSADRSQLAEPHAVGPGRLHGLVAVVTGGGRGLGRTIAERLAHEGARVHVADVAGASDVAERITRRGSSARSWSLDVSDPAAVDSVVTQAAQEWGGIDVLVNSAGLLSGQTSVDEVTRSEMLRYFEVNAVGYLLMVQACRPWLRASVHRGRVVLVASRTAVLGGTGRLAYVASKGAAMAMTRSLARELGEDRITVNSVLPAQIATPGTEAHSDEAVFDATMQQQAIKERVQASDLAGLVVFLAGDDARLITGQSLVVDGGGLLN